VIELVETFFEALSSAADLGTAAADSPAELMGALDQVISTYLEENQFLAETYNAAQQDVFNTIAANLHEQHLAESSAIGLDSHGNANAADVIAALDSHYHEIASTPIDDNAFNIMGHRELSESFSSHEFDHGTMGQESKSNQQKAPIEWGLCRRR